LVTLDAGTRGLILLNTTITPDVLRVRLAPAFARLSAAQEAGARDRNAATTQPDRLARLKALGELRDAGVLDADEFLAEKARILASE